MMCSSDAVISFHNVAQHLVMGTAEEEARTVYGDPDDFAGEMVKMINDKEFR